MKKILLFIPAIITLLVSCAQMEQEAIPSKDPVVSEGYKVLTIKATKSGIDHDTKTSYASEKEFSWCVGDKISVICNNGTENFWQTFTATTADATSTFTATVEGNVYLGPKEDGHYKVAMYPASESHVYSGNWSLKYHIPAQRDFRAASGGHQEAAIPMFAWGTDEDEYAFSNLTGAAKFSFKGITCSAVKMTYTVPDVKLNGTYSLLYDSIDLSNSSNVHWNAASGANASEKTVTYYADVVDGKASFYLPYATGTIWGDGTLKLYDAETDDELYSHNHVGSIVITKNKIAVLPTLTVGSAFGVDWSRVMAAVNSNDDYPAIRSMKATMDDYYLYILLDVDPSKLTKNHTYDHYIKLYIADGSGSNHHWNEKNKTIGKSSWAVSSGSIAFKNWDATFSDSALDAQLDKWTYEVRIHRDYCAALSAGSLKIGVELDDTYYDGSYGHLQSETPYGVIPSYGSALYEVSSIPGPLPASPLYLGFSEASGEVPNPERGMMSYSKFVFENSTIPSVKDIPVDYTGESLAFLLFYLTDYIGKNLDEDALNYIRTEFGKVRLANKKAVVRFAYSESFTTTDPQEATPTQILTHIDQIADILSDNADILYAVQAGWLGTYGEWYYVTNSHGNSVPSYTDYYLYTVDGSTVADFNGNYKNLMDRVLAKVPSPIQIGLRTSTYKRYYLSPSNIGSWTSIDAWGTDANHRIGFYNDGLRGSTDDVGTFHNDTDRDMWYSQGNWVICGGEMSYRSDSEWAALSDDLKDCKKSITEMRKQHLSYLHYSESNKFMVKWIGEGHMEDLKKMLGYRLVLGDVDLTYSALTSGSTVNYSIQMKNTGCAPVYYARPFKLVLLHSSGASTVLVDNLGDVRNLAPGADFTTLSGSFELSADVANGDKLAIWLPDNASGLQANAAYSIRLANKEVTWTDGYNVLYTF